MITKARKQSDKKIRQKYKQMLHELKINGCAVCGYDKCDAALDFHHVNPEDKKFSLGLAGMRLQTSKDYGAELNKCILLCCRCHKEIENNELQRLKTVFSGIKFTNTIKNGDN